MIRKINVTHHKHKQSIQGFSDVQITEVDTLVNYSIDFIYCCILNKIEKSKIHYYLDIIVNKIRYGGQLILVITDIRNVCKAYINKTISEEDFFNTMKDASIFLSEEELVTYIISKHKLDPIGIEKHNNNIAITFQRKTND